MIIFIYLSFYFNNFVKSEIAIDFGIWTMQFLLLQPTIPYEGFCYYL